MKTTRVKPAHRPNWMFLKRNQEVKQRTKTKIVDEIDENYGVGYKNPLMVLQLAKIIDSEGNPIELDSVKTDDDHNIKVALDEAKLLHALYYSVDTKRRRQLTEDWQYAETFNKYLSKLR